MKLKPIFLYILVPLLLIFAAMAIVAGSSRNQNQSATLHIVAGENMWGSLVSQLGGSHVSVTSIISDPNADPHDYESTTASARAFAQADYVILNGAGYDQWGQKLLDANPNSQRKTLTIASLLGKTNGDNPHFWYSPIYVNRAVVQMSDDLTALDPNHAAYYQQQLQKLQGKLAGYQGEITAIKHAYGGAKIAATEDIVEYTTQAAGLNLISPESFMQAAAEGNSPSASSVATFENQLQSGEPKVLMYNSQTTSKLTENMKKMAQARNIPVVGVTEITQPANATFESWMDAQITALQQALSKEQS